VTNYVIFHEVKFAEGIVQTGWRYQSSEDDAPSFQYCLFRIPGPDATSGVHVWTIAEDRKPNIFDSSPGLDVNAALNNCVWFQQTMGKTSL
jgi:hypothetical protein